MHINITHIAERYLPAKLLVRAGPAIGMADTVLNGTDDNASAQRMALAVFVIRVLSAVIAFVSQVLLARWLGSFQYGIFVTVWVGLMIAGSLSSIGFPSAIVRLVAEYRQKEVYGLLRGTIFASFLITFGSSVLAAIAGTIVLLWFPYLVTDYLIAPIFLALVCLPVLAAEDIMVSLSRALNWTLIGFVPTYIIRPLGILLILGIALLIGYEPNAITAMWSGVFACYITAGLQFFIVSRKMSDEVPTARGEYRLRDWTLIAIPLFLVEGFYFLQTSVDILLVSAYMSPENTAVYFASTKILALVHFVYFAVRAAAAHRYTAFHTSGDIEGFRAFVQKTISWTFWPSLVLAAIMAILGKYFLMLFGQEFVGGEHLIWILALGVVVRASVGPAESLLVMSGKHNICATIYGIALVVNIALNISLIPSLGLAGAAIATTVAIAFESAALHAMAKRKLGIHAFIVPQRIKLSEGLT